MTLLTGLKHHRFKYPNSTKPGTDQSLYETRGDSVFTIHTYQHVLPGMQAVAAGVFEKLIVPKASTG